MALPSSPRPLGILARDLLAATALAVGLYVLFAIFNGRLLHGFTEPEVLLLEAGAVVAVAFLVARAVGNATNALLRRHGLDPAGWPESVTTTLWP